MSKRLSVACVYSARAYREFEVDDVEVEHDTEIEVGHCTGVGEQSVEEESGQTATAIRRRISAPHAPSPTQTQMLVERRRGQKQKQKQKQKQRYQREEERGRNRC
jgi:hypothetical protein